MLGTAPRVSGTRSRSEPSPTITRDSPSVASVNSSTPFSGESRPRKSTCGGSSGSRTVAGSRTGLGITRTSDAPSARAASASAVDAQIASRARPRIGRKSRGARRASSTSVPQSWTTNGFPVDAAARPDGNQCAWTRSASAAALRAARA